MPTLYDEMKKPGYQPTPSSKRRSRLYWRRRNLEYTKRVVSKGHPYGITLLRVWPIKVVRAIANRYGFGVEGANPRTCQFVNYGTC